ncbi:MAG TPA: hypothetical protein VGI91_03400 [Steroidobacteraceae bacterium]|jgi:hypothetical protein
MADELDANLLRAFAQTESPLPAEPFVAQTAARLQPGRGPLRSAGLYSLIGGVLTSLAGGILLPLRMRQTRLMTLGAAAMTIWAAFL